MNTSLEEVLRAARVIAAANTYGDLCQEDLADLQRALRDYDAEVDKRFLPTPEDRLAFDMNLSTGTMLPLDEPLASRKAPPE
jgi:hypothetical protein